MNGKFGGGKGTTEKPYIVEDIFDFHKIRVRPNKCYKLNNNIDFNTPPFDKGFLPIKNFTGQLDGNGYKLLNVYINKTTMTNVGIFETIEFYNINYQNQRPCIKNLVVENADVYSMGTSGILVGKMIYHYNWNTSNYGAFFDNVYVSGKVSGKEYCGSLVGYLYLEQGYANSFTFARNIQLNTTLKPQSNLCYSSPMFGFVQTNNGSYSTNVSLFRDTYINTEMDDSLVTLQPARNSVCCNCNVTQTDSVHYKTPNTFVDTTNWKGATSAYLNCLDTETIATSNKMEFFQNALESLETWKLRYNTAPELKILHKDVVLFYVPANHKYYKYDLSDEKNPKFTEVKVLDYKKIENESMDMSKINNEVFQKALSDIGNFKIVNIVDKDNGMVVKYDKNFALSRDSVNDYNNKVIFKKQLSFDTIGKDVFQVISTIE